MSEALRVTNHDYEWCPKYYGVIVGLFCSLYMITTAINTKLADVVHFVLPAGLITFPLCCVISDLLTEVYGFNRTRKAVWTVLVCTILFAVFTWIAVALPPASFWENQSAYVAVFNTVPRMVLAGCMAWLAGEFLNSYVMSKMKLKQKAKNVSVRFIASTIVGQFADTVVFCGVAFIGTMPWQVWIKMVAVAWAFKVGYEVVALPLTVPVALWVKRLEGIEHFDRQKISLV